jgi:predicted lipid-binding transport protein (Tim44 family)
MVIIMVYVISRLAIDYAKELAIGLGCAAIIFGHLMASAFGGISVSMGQIILMTVICGALAWLGRFFDPMLDYKRAEYVQFQDDDNYYYVRLIPKIQMTSPAGPPTPAPRRPRADEDEY